MSAAASRDSRSRAAFRAAVWPARSSNASPLDDGRGGITLYPNGMRALAAVGVATEVEAPVACSIACASSIERVGSGTRDGRHMGGRRAILHDRSPGPAARAVRGRCADSDATRRRSRIDRGRRGTGDVASATHARSLFAGRRCGWHRSRVRALHFGPIRPSTSDRSTGGRAPIELVSCATMMVDVDRMSWSCRSARVSYSPGS